MKKEAGEADQPVRVIQKSIVRTQLQTAQGMTIITKINDGEYVWSEYRFRETGKVRVARRKIDKDAPPRDPFQADLHEYVRKLRESYAFRTLRKDTFDDEPVLVLEGTLRATPKKDAKEPPREVLPRGVVLHVARSDHFPRKVEVFVKAKDDGADAPAPDVSVRLTRVRLNQGLKPDTFKYSLPEGAELIDVK